MTYMKEYKNALISIVMINYNWLNYLKRTIPAILALKHENKEFIIVDNGSTDWSIEFIKSFDTVKLIQSPKMREKNFACNLWVENAKWEYILICDNDLLIVDILLLTNLLEKYNNSENTWIVWLSFTNEWEETTKWYWNYIWYYYTKEKKSVSISKVALLDWNKIAFPSWIWFFIKKDIWNKLWGYDDFLKFWWDDSDIWIKSWLFWYENYLYSKTTQLHIWMAERKDNKKFQVKFKEMFFADMYTITKNFTFKNATIITFIYSLYYFLRAIKQSVFRFHLGPFLAFFQWYWLFLKNLPIAIKKRKNIQEKRVIKSDIFLFNSDT